MKPFLRQLFELRLLSSTALRVYFLGLFMLAGLGVLGAKLYHEQVNNRVKWTAKVRTSSHVTVRVPSVRGEIRDRNGVRLATNRTTYGVDFYLKQIEQGYRDRNGGKVPVAIYHTTRDSMPDDVKVADIVQIVNSTIIPHFQNLDLASDPLIRTLDYNATDGLERHFRTNEQVPYHFFEQVSFDTVAKLAEHGTALPGIEITMRPAREYIFGSLGAHFLGYVGAPKDIDKEPDFEDFTYYQPDIVGASSIEKYCDKWLRGKPGVRVLERTAKGQIGAELPDKSSKPVPGANVYLTIDARIQAIVENTLREAGVGRAAVVVVNPANGDILAMENAPNYEPNTFKEQLKMLDTDKTNPLLNRCINPYVPGSTFKAVTALAALRAGLSSRTPYVCDGFKEYGGRKMKCHIYGRGVHGSVHMLTGIQRSCNCYFFQLANSITDGDQKTGLQHIEAIGTALGLGQRSGLPLSGENPGILPGPQWLTANGLAETINSAGNIANTSIGQGRVTASPLQMAMVCATVGNGGISYYPRLISRVVDQNNEDLREPDGSLTVPVEPRIRANLLDLGLTATQIEIVRRGMWMVVNEPAGTGKRAAIKGVEVAGKTGTAQFSREVEGTDERGRPLPPVPDNRVWFMCFAPYKQPRYAICVMIEGAKSGGGVAAPVAQKILKECLGLEVGTHIDVAWRDPLVGNFEHTEEITLSENGSLTKLVLNAFKGTDQKPIPGRAADMDEELSIDHGDAPVERRSTQAAADAPQAPDARGKVGTGGLRRPGLFQRLFGPRKTTPPNNPPGPPGRR